MKLTTEISIFYTMPCSALKDGGVSSTSQRVLESRAKKVDSRSRV